MAKKNYIFTANKPKILPVYLLSLALSLWGIGNIFYWEIYKGYSACTSCEWHRVNYISLFILLLILFKYRKLFIKILIWISLSLEVLVSLPQVFEPFSSLACNYISLADQLNLLLVLGTIILTVIFELKAYLKYQKKLRSQVKHVNHVPNIKISYKSNVCL